MLFSSDGTRYARHQVGDSIQNVSYLLLSMAEEMLWFGDVLIMTMWVPLIA